MEAANRNDITEKAKELALEMAEVKIETNQRKIIVPRKPLDIKEVQNLHINTHGMPKIELHAHIGGCFRPSTFLELAEREGVDLDRIDFYKVTIEIAFEFFKIGAQLVKDLKTLQRVTYEIIEDYAKQNTRYLELRSTPKELGGKSKDDYVKAIFEVIEQAELDFPRIKVRYLISINRQAGIIAAREAVGLAVQYKETYLVGLELSGDPRYGHFSEYVELFESAR